MFQSFTGNSRRPRQVNLSGRATNPFAAFPGNSPTRQTPHAANPESAVAIAQRERALRQLERDRQTASRTVQRVWRGHRSRKATYKVWKSEWDTLEWERVTTALDFDDDRRPRTEVERLECLARLSAPPYPTAEQCLDQLRLLVQFVGLATKKEDVLRLVYFCNVFEQTFHALPTIATENDWTELLKRLATAILHALGSARNSPTHEAAVLPLLRTIVFLVDLIPKRMASIGKHYYQTMAFLTKNIDSLRGTLSPETVTNAVLALLRPITSETIAAYEALAMSYLTIPNLPAYLGELDGLAHQINYKLLAPAIESCIPLAKERLSTDDVEGIEGRLWLLAYLIFFHRYALPGQANLQAPDLEFLNVVSGLLNSTSVYLTRCLEADENGPDPARGPYLDQFVADQVSSLVNQSSITGLLSRIKTSYLSHTDISNDYNASREAKILATYALNLLRVFPRRGDDIRMWLYLGSAPSADLTSGQPGAKVPAIKYFWQASKSSRIFDTISKDSSQVLPLLQLPQDGNQEDQEQEWTIILLFFELYTFVLKVMDDEEFFSSASPFAASQNVLSSWTKESALPLKDVKDMTVFLKNLAFTLYWNVADLTKKGPVPSSAVDLRSYFSNTAQVSGPMERTEVETKKEINDLPGVTGIPLDYFKGLVTGLLRMLHERE
jgi:ubiquitin-protein ligase E3 C